MNDKSSSAVHRAEQALRAHILACSDGDFLGSEQQMLELLGVSRPTFRQVAKLLERDHLLEIRRGVGGGFYARNPNIEAVAQAAAVYLQFERATLRHATLAATQLSREAVRLAVQCQDSELRSDLSRFLAEDRNALEHDCPLDEFIRSEVAFVRLLSSMSGNPVIKLLLNILYHFATPAVGGVIFDDTQHMRNSRKTRISTAEAILGGDAELAMLMFRRHIDSQYSRLKSLHGDGGLDVPLF